jgi:hypothetical protein
MRLAAFTHFLKQGMAPNQAARLVREYMADYNHLTAAERKVRRFLVPFYNFAKFAAGRSVMAMLMQPGAFAGYQHLTSAIDHATGFDRDVLPGYLQWAVVLGDDATGRVVFINPQPPWQQLFSATSEEWPVGVLEVGREGLKSLTPFVPAVYMLAKGREFETGRTVDEPFSEENPHIHRLKEALKKFVPYWEYEKLYPERPGADLLTTGALVKGAKGYPLSFISTYDVPLAKARNIQRAKKALDDYITRLKEEGRVREMPETRDVERAKKALARQESFRRVLGELKRGDPEKTRLAKTLVAGSRDPLSALFVLGEHADLLDGTPEQVRSKLQQLFNQENTRRLTVYLGRKPTVRDFLDHRGALEDGTLEQVPPQIRRLERAVELFKQAQGAGGNR